MPEENNDNDQNTVNHDTSLTRVPAWFPIAGVVFGGLTLIFFMAMVLMGSKLELDGNTRFFAIAVFAFGTAMSASFIGGSAAASGSVPIPFAKKDPMKFSAAGGFATLVIAALVGAYLFPAAA